MKAYGKKRKCWCIGFPYEKCNLCVPTAEEKKQMRRSTRKKIKLETKIYCVTLTPLED